MVGRDGCGTETAGAETAGAETGGIAVAGSDGDTGGTIGIGKENGGT